MKPFLTVLAVLICAVPALSFAHTGIAKSNPKDGAELAESPAAIELEFHEAAKLTSVVVVAADKTSRRLEFTAGTNAKTYSVPNPKLTAGRNEVQWKALSKDGHVASGSLVFTIKPAAKAK